METSSSHHRDSSLSSASSFHSGSLHSTSIHSADTNTFMTDVPEVLCESLSIHPPLRNRLASGMAIIAATSPEIKALNLPITPCFPAELQKNQCSSSVTCTSPSSAPNSFISSSAISSSRTTNALIPLLAKTMEDEIQVKEGDLDSEALKIWLNGNEETLVQSFDGCSIQTVPPPARTKVTRFQNGHDDKENVHPNLTEKNEKTSFSKSCQPFGSHRFNQTTTVPANNAQQWPAKRMINRPSMIKRPSFHRRASMDSLPSPEEIGPASKLALNRGGSCGHFSFDQVEQEQADEESIRRHHHQPRRDHRPNARIMPRSLNLTTGFR